MAEYIDKASIIAEIEKKIKQYEDAFNNPSFASYEASLIAKGKYRKLLDILQFINTLEVINPYEEHIQYDSIKSGIQRHTETYSFNIESKLFPQLTKEQQELWRKEIEQAVISGGEVGVELAKDTRYKENLEVKKVENTELLKLKGYLVRDKDDYTAIYAEKPHRGKTEWVKGNDSCLMTINDARLVPDIEFKDEPVEVKVTLERV